MYYLINVCPLYCYSLTYFLTLHQDALEIRSYFHDRSLMEYADRLETSRKSLAELLTLSTLVLSSQFGMKRGHITRFIDRGCACRVAMPRSYALPARQRTVSSVSLQNDSFLSSRKMQNVRSTLRASSKYGSIIDKPISDFKVDDDYVFKGIVAAGSAEPRFCCCGHPPPIIDDCVAPYSSIENISVQKLTSEYKVGRGLLVATKAPPIKASCLWNDKLVLLLCVRRPG